MQSTNTILTLTGISDLTAQSTGNPALTIGIVDGPIDQSHPDLQETDIRSITTKRVSLCQAQNSVACKHGTFVAGILAARSNSEVPGICPGCKILSRPIFCEANNLNDCPRVGAIELATAINELLDHKVNIINLSLGIAPASLSGHPMALSKAFDRARVQGCLIIGASGNHSSIGHNPLFSHSWVIPVAACDYRGNILPISNMSASVGKRGLLAPGWQINSTHSGGGHIRMTGTSAACPIVTGTAALLWSLRPQTSAYRLKSALLNTGNRRKSIVPPLLNGARALQSLNHN